MAGGQRRPGGRGRRPSHAPQLCILSHLLDNVSRFVRHLTTPAAAEMTARTDARQTTYRVQVKRVYEPPHAGDGVRILIDRVWPRGLSKARAGVDHWMKDLAPTTALRKWFGHDPEKWDEFRRRYHAELDTSAHTLAALRVMTRECRVTLVYGARGTEYNNALALRECLERP